MPTQQQGRLLLFSVNGIIYLFRDEFTPDLAAGSVNGTAAEPGPGNRTVVDTESKLSLSGGKASFASGKTVASFSDPKLSFASQSRVVGKILVVEFNISILASKQLTLGYDSPSMRLNSTVSVIIDNGSISPVVASGLSISTSYKAVFVMNSTGGQVFLQGGTYTYPTLLYRPPKSATALTPSLNSFSATFTSDFIRLPQDVWLARPLASDGFASAFGTTDGLGHVDGNTALGAGGSGLTWSQVGTWTITTGKANASALSGGLAIATVVCSTKDVLVAADLGRSAGVGGIVLRYTDASNYLIAYHDGTNAKLDQVLAGVTTNKITAAATFVTNATIVAELESVNGQLWYNDVRIGTTTAIDASLTATAHGIYTTDTGNTIDNFNVFSRGASNEYASLTSFFQ